MQEAWVIWLFSYALGSISPSYFIGRRVLHKDLRTQGTGNLGSMNVYYNIGTTASVFCAAFDVLKGVFPLLLALYFSIPEYALYVTALSTILGHCFPFYLGFRGGKGLATTIGTLCTLWGMYLVFHNLQFNILGPITLVAIVFYLFFMVYLTKKYHHKIETLNERQQQLMELEQRLKKKRKSTDQPTPKKQE